jgi:hypothetical protein
MYLRLHRCVDKYGINGLIWKLAADYNPNCALFHFVFGCKMWMLIAATLGLIPSVVYGPLRRIIE